MAGIVMRRWTQFKSTVIHLFLCKLLLQRVVGRWGWVGELFIELGLNFVCLCVWVFVCVHFCVCIHKVEWMSQVSMQACVCVSKVLCAWMYARAWIIHVCCVFYVCVPRWQGYSCVDECLSLNNPVQVCSCFGWNNQGFICVCKCVDCLSFTDQG